MMFGKTICLTATDRVSSGERTQQRTDGRTPTSHSRDIKSHSSRQMSLYVLNDITVEAID